MGKCRSWTLGLGDGGPCSTAIPNVAPWHDDGRDASVQITTDAPPASCLAVISPKSGRRGLFAFLSKKLRKPFAPGPSSRPVVIDIGPLFRA